MGKKKAPLKQHIHQQKQNGMLLRKVAARIMAVEYYEFASLINERGRN